MKKATSRVTIMMTCAIAALANAPLSLADAFSGTLGAGSATRESTDVYALTCPPGTSTVRARITSSQANEISVQVISPIGRATTVVSVPFVSPQPTARLAASAGNFLVTVHKSPTNSSVSYEISLDCYNANGAPFENVQSVLVQNQ